MNKQQAINELKKTRIKITEWDYNRANKKFYVKADYYGEIIRAEDLSTPRNVVGMLKLEAELIDEQFYL